MTTRSSERKPAMVWVMVAIAAIGSIGLAEAALRAYTVLADTELARAIARQDPFAVIRVPYGEYGYRQRPNAVQNYPNDTVATSNEMGFRGPTVAWEKPAGTFRILLLGGSATHGWGVNDNETIDAYMRALFDSRGDGPRVEVVNLALDGYDSAQAFERMRSDGVRFTPDLVILNAGVNDVRNARIPELHSHPDPRTSIWERAMAQMREEQQSGSQSSWTLAKHYLYLARFPGIVRDRTQGQPGQSQGRIEPYPEAADYFERSLEKIWQLTDEAGGALLLSTPPSALETRHTPDETSDIGYWINDAGTTAAYRKRLAGRMQAFASAQSALGHPVRHVSHTLAPDAFLDDCHLTPTGNRGLAEAFVADAKPFIAAPAKRREAR